MTHDELCIVAGKWLKRTGVINLASEMDNKIPIPLVTVNNHLMYNVEHPDVIGFSTDTKNTVVIEVKMTRSDFKRDSKKSHRINIGMGDMKYYCCPEGLIKESEIPYGWGLLYLCGKTIKIIKEGDRHLFVDRKSERYLLGYYLRFPDKFSTNKI